MRLTESILTKLNESDLLNKHNKVERENLTEDTEENDPILDKTIKVYDINAIIDKEVNKDSEEKYRSFDFDGGAAIIVKSDGSGCIVNYEAVGNTFNATSDTINVDLCPVDGDDGNGHRTISIMATARVKCTIDELLQAPSKEMKVREFFRKYNYNDRCEQNFENIKPYLTECDKSLKEDTLSSDEYYVIGKDDFQALLDKNGGAFENGYLAITKDEANELAKKQGLLINSNGVFSGEEE